MSHRKALSDIANILTIRELEKSVALEEFAVAVDQETRCLAEKAKADSELEQARQDWRENLLDENLVPEIVQYLSKNLVKKHQDREISEEDLIDAKSVSNLKQRNWIYRDALVSQSLNVQRRHKRELDKSQEEKRMSDLEDIVAFKWWEK